MSHSTKALQGISPEETAFVLEHLRSLRSKGCTRCGNVTWNVVGTVAAPAFDSASDALGMGGVPLLVVVCETCCCVDFYAWVDLRTRFRKQQAGT